MGARVASSFISIEQAERNLNELGSDDFATIERKGRAVWNKTLGRVEVEGGTIDQLRTFYSSLYRMLFFPMRLYEKDAGGAIVHYSPYNWQDRTRVSFRWDPVSGIRSGRCIHF